MTHKPQRQKTNKQQNKEIYCACSPAEAEEVGMWDLNRGDILLADSRMHRECWATKSHSKMLSQIQNVLENLLTLLFINSWTLIYNTSRYQIFKNMLRNIFPLNDELVLMFLNKKIHKWRFGVQPVLCCSFITAAFIQISRCQSGSLNSWWQSWEHI